MDFKYYEFQAQDGFSSMDAGFEQYAPIRRVFPPFEFFENAFALRKPVRNERFPYVDGGENSNIGAWVMSLLKKRSPT